MGKSEILDIGLDMDGVIVNFLDPVCKWLGVKQTDMTSYKLEDMYPDDPDKVAQIRNYYSQKGYFKNLKPFPGALEFIKKLQKLENSRIWYVSKPAIFSPITWADKVEWILNHTPKLIKTTILTGDKCRSAVDILVDDDPDNLTTSIAKYKILFDQPWNHDDTTFNRVKNYEELYSKIVKISKKEKK